MSEAQNDARRFLDLSAQVVDTSEDESESGSDADFVNDAEVVRPYGPIVTMLLEDSDGSLSAEEMASEIVERARKRRRMEIAESSSSNPASDALTRQLSSKCPLFPEDLEVDDSEYELYYVRAKNAPLEARTFRDHFPRHCTAFHIPMIPRRVYLWVPNVQAIRDMFYACARPSDGERRVHVPRAEQGEVFASLNMRVPSFPIASWVRVKKGLFSGDFGIVQEILQDGLALQLGITARIHDSPERDNVTRPEKRLATLPWLRQTFKTEPIVHHEDGTYLFRKSLYRDGLRLLRIPVWRVESAFPDLHEVHALSLPHLGELQDVECYTQVSDVVAIHSGPFQNLVGVVAERTGVNVVLRDIRRIVVDEEDDANWFARTSKDDGDDRTDGERIRDLRRSDVLFEIRYSQPDDSISETITTHIRTLRRYLDVGDEVTVRVGLHTGKSGMIVEQHGDMLNIRMPGDDDFTLDRLEFSVPRFWVQTVAPQPPSSNRLTAPREEKQIKKGLPFFPGDFVCICVGIYAGRWGVVRDLEEEKDNVHVVIRGREGQEDRVVAFAPSSLSKWSWDILSDGKLPDTSSRVSFEKTRRSRFVGTSVFVWRRGDSSLAVREAKGMHGFVMDVDEERKTARVSYQNKEATLPLKSLLSLDYLCCLDRDAKLNEGERWRLFAQVSEHQARYDSRVTRFPGIGVQQEPTPQTSAEPQQPRSMALEPITDFSQPGYWVLHPDVRRYYAGHKVFVRSTKQDRAGYITGPEIGEDHSRCFGTHDRCAVRVHIARGSSVSETSIEVSELEPCRPVKKNETVLHVRGLEGAPIRVLVATSVPKQRDQPLSVCVPGNEKRDLCYLHGWQVTKIEAK